MSYRQIYRTLARAREVDVFFPRGMRPARRTCDRLGRRPSGGLEGRSRSAYAPQDEAAGAATSAFTRPENPLQHLEKAQNGLGHGSRSAAARTAASGAKSRAGLAVAVDAVLEGAELFHPDRPTGVHPARGDADLGPEAELPTVGELGRSIVQHDRRIDLLQELFRRRLVLGDDAVGVVRPKGFDVVDRRLEAVDHPDGDDRVEIFGPPVVVRRGLHPGVALLRGRVAANFA